MARVIAVECERSVCAVVPLCCVGVLGHAAALGTGVEGLGTRNYRVFLLIPIKGVDPEIPRSPHNTYPSEDHLSGQRFVGFEAPATVAATRQM